MPNYPDGVIHKSYKGRVFVRETWQGILIIRTWVFAVANKGFLPRILNHFSFAITSLVAAWSIIGTQVIITESPPLFTGISGLLLAKWLKAKHVFNIADLWPDSAIELGVLKNRFLVNISYKLAHYIYGKSDLISVTAAGQNRRLVKQGVSKNRIVHISNGVDISFFSPNGVLNRFKAEHGWKDKFVVFYGGTLGMAHGLKSMIEAARILSDREYILFVLAGNGAEKDSLVLLCESYGLKNVQFINIQPRSQMPDIINSVDACLVHLRDLVIFQDVLPSKTFEYMACCKPVIMGVKGEASRIIQKAQAGICIQPESPKDLAKAVLRLSENRVLCEEFGMNGRCFVERYLSRDLISRKLEATLQGLIIGNKRAKT